MIRGERCRRSDASIRRRRPRAARDFPGSPALERRSQGRPHSHRVLPPRVRDELESEERQIEEEEKGSDWKLFVKATNSGHGSLGLFGSGVHCFMKPPPLAVRLEKALPFRRFQRARARARARARPDFGPANTKTAESFLRKRIGQGHGQGHGHE